MSGYFDPYRKSHLVAWVRIMVDPHAQFRGFSIERRELRVMGYDPIQDEMEDLSGNRQPGKFWVVAAIEVYRVIPELRRFKIRNEPWFFPVEFCESFVRPWDYLEGKVIEHTLVPPDEKEKAKP